MILILKERQGRARVVRGTTRKGRIKQRQSGSLFVRVFRLWTVRTSSLPGELTPTSLLEADVIRLHSTALT